SLEELPGLSLTSDTRTWRVLNSCNWSRSSTLTQPVQSSVWPFDTPRSPAEYTPKPFALDDLPYTPIPLPVEAELTPRTACDRDWRWSPSTRCRCPPPPRSPCRTRGRPRCWPRRDLHARDHRSTPMRRFRDPCSWPGMPGPCQTRTVTCW